MVVGEELRSRIGNRMMAGLRGSSLFLKLELFRGLLT